MDDQGWLAERFEENRPHLHAVAYRMLGSATEAEDAVQESWLRLSRSGAEGIDNLSGWLTTIVGRVCLDMLRSRRSRAETSLDREPVAASDPEHQAVLADSMGIALLVVLERLSPSERVAFVLHDLFGLPFEEIAPIIDRTPAAARQLASRGRRRVQGGEVGSPPDRRHQREVVDAFLAASRRGDFSALLQVLHPDVILRADSAAVAMGATAEARGAVKVAETFAGRARAAEPVLVDGVPGLVWAQRGRPQVVFRFVIGGETITRIELVADPERLNTMQLEKA